MDFGVWVQDTRKKRGLDVRTFAEQAGVDPSTISRIENQRTQATLYTAFRICKVVDVSVGELVQILTGEYPPSLRTDKKTANSLRPVAVSDIEKVIERFRANNHLVKRTLVSLFNRIASELKDTNSKHGVHSERGEQLISFGPEDIDKFLYASPLYDPLELRYPPTINSENILQSYQYSGALMLRDAEKYAEQTRPKGIPSMSPGTGGSGASATLERIKLSEILSFDRKSMQKGIVIGMYWSACEFNVTFSSPSYREDIHHPSLFDALDEHKPRIEHEEWEIRLANFYLTMYRWYQSLKIIAIWQQLTQ